MGPVIRIFEDIFVVYLCGSLSNLVFRSINFLRGWMEAPWLTAFHKFTRPCQIYFLGLM